MVFGGGIELVGSPYAGTVQERSPQSSASYNRAKGLERLVGQVPLDRAILSGLVSFRVPPARLPLGKSEASAMHEVINPRAVSGLSITDEQRARTTLGKAVYSAYMLDPEATVFTVTHSYHMPRAVSALEQALPEATILPFSVDVPPVQPSLRDRANQIGATILYDFALRDVAAGDLLSLETADQWVQNTMNGGVLKAVEHLSGIVREYALG